MRLWILGLLLLCSRYALSDSVNLFNDTQYTLQAVIYDANGTVMGQFVLNSRDATEWSNNDQDFGAEMQYSSQTPYTVTWTCMGGSAYGSCNNVAAGSTVTAQSCGGVQECPSSSTSCATSSCEEKR